WSAAGNREVLAAGRVGGELGLDRVWSGGWARFAGMPKDPAQETAACVYLWARDPSLCNAPLVAGRGFDSTREQPAETGGRVRMLVLMSRYPVWLGVRATAKLRAPVAVGQEAIPGGRRALSRIGLAPFLSPGARGLLALW